VPAGGAVATRVELAAVEAKGRGRYLVRTTNTAYLADNIERPVLVAESLAMVMA
jgi:acyl dehydratase